MFNDAAGFNRIFIACGYTDLRRGIDGLAAAIKNDFHMDPYEQDRKSTRLNSSHIH